LRGAAPKFLLELGVDHLRTRKGKLQKLHSVARVNLRRHFAATDREWMMTAANEISTRDAMSTLNSTHSYMNSCLMPHN